MSSASCNLNAAPMEENFIADFDARAPPIPTAFELALLGSSFAANISRNRDCSESASSFW